MVTRADSYRHFGEECLRLNLRPLPCEGKGFGKSGYSSTT